MTSQILAVANRVLRQLTHDRRFMALSIVVPSVIIYMLYLFFEAMSNPFFDPKVFITPVGAFIVRFLTYILSTVVLVRERTQSTMTRMFISGYQRFSIIFGYVLAYVVIATLQSLIVLVMMNWLFELGYRWDEFLSMYAIIWLLAAISIALAILVSNFARNEGQVLPMIPLVTLPSVFFSGMIVAVDKLPEWISWLSYITPMFYATNAIEALSDGLDWALVGALLLYGVIVLGLAVFTLREQE